MRGFAQATLGIATLMLASGCVRAQTKLKEMPRVDLNVTEGGNRGFLVGTPPASQPRKTTRQMIGTDIEIPSFYKPKPGSVPAQLDTAATPDTDADEGGGASQETATHHDSYVVQKGDSLWSIAAKPEMYGRASKWRRIFDADRDLLKSPDRIRAGMTLKIPRGDEADGGSITYDDEGGAYKK